MPLGPVRDKVLYGILQKRAGVHPYSLVRWVVGVAFTVGVALLPLLDVIRFDLWGGNHVYLGEQRPLLDVLRAFAFPFLAVNIAIVLVTRLLGRYLCGFVCPVGSLARFAEWARFRTRKGQRQFLAPLFVLLVCALMAAITFSFWVDWRVFADGSALAIALSSLFLGGTTLVLFGTVQVLGLRFCRDWCPSGVYFAALGHQTVNGIEFAHPETCTDCKACERVCPVDLEPRDMAGGPYRGGLGFYGDGMSNFALCLRCGDCVIACEGANARRGDPLPLRMGHLAPQAREHRDGVRETPPAGAAPARRKSAGPERAGAPREGAACRSQES